MEIFLMILKMSALTLLSVLLTYMLWKITKDKPMSAGLRICIGVVFGLFSVLSTHLGVDYSSMILNVRDLGPMSAGLFFDPVSGIIAGLIGGIERYIAGTYWHVGSFTRYACSISTCLAGFVAAFMNRFIFNGKKPSASYAFFMGAVIETFHMYAVFATHRDVMDMAYMVVHVCAIPMIVFCGIGLFCSSIVLRISSGEWNNPIDHTDSKKVPVSHKFSVWLFAVTSIVLAISFGMSFYLQTLSAEQNAKTEIVYSRDDISRLYKMLKSQDEDVSNMVCHVGLGGWFSIIDNEGHTLAGEDVMSEYRDDVAAVLDTNISDDYFNCEINGEEFLGIIHPLYDSSKALICIPFSELYKSRNIQAYETFLADILVFTVIFILISLLVQGLVVNNLIMVNESLNKITDGNLDEKVKVYNSSEFTSLSDDINLTVEALKGYIDAAEKRIEQELILAHNIQDSALPKNFDFTHTGFKVFASTEPAKEVGGDFYDVFFVDTNRVALVVADVSGKGIPAALFMMRSKTAIRGRAETGKNLQDVFTSVNNELCEGNDNNMFVTVWMAIINLEDGTAKCINAGHEYPAIMRKDGEYELLKDKHSLPLGAMEGIPFKPYEIKLEPGTKLFIYSDGVPEATASDNQLFGTQRMIDALNSDKDADPERTLVNVRSHVDAFVKDAVQFDDLTMLCFEYLGE